MQRAPNLSALRAPFQFFTGWGSFQRRSPTGGAANGIPLKLRTPSFGAAVDSTTPLAVLTRSAANVLAPRNPQRSKASANLSMKFPFAADFPEVLTESSPGMLSLASASARGTASWREDQGSQ